MKPNWGERLTLAFEGVVQMVDAAIALGLISGSAIAILFGQIVLAIILAVLAFGVFLRFKRGRVAK